jgi:hypothetical protein
VLPATFSETLDSLPNRALCVNMGWLNPVLGVEEEAIGPNSEHRRHPETCSLDDRRGKPPVTRTRRSALSAAHRAFLCRLTDRVKLRRTQ